MVAARGGVEVNCFVARGKNHIINYWRNIKLSTGIFNSAGLRLGQRALVAMSIHERKKVRYKGLAPFHDDRTSRNVHSDSER